jgi:transcriptional regulator with XRE-family HTH domain
MEKNAFTEFLENSFVKWQSQMGKRKTIKEFSEYLGVSRPLLSMWMLGRQRPGPKNIELLANKLGPEVYDVLGFPRPNPDLQALMAAWNYIPSEKQHAMREQGEQYKIQNQNDEK